ncbi:MAG: single-stranded DNA-binding protein [Opitutaceae bacterium]|nr:single-stranded DNA-binding protein [Opitutaceae bacterium]
MSSIGELIKPLTKAAQTLKTGTGKLHFSDPVTHVYNPLEYAWDSHKAYIERYAKPTARVLFMGMNPGPWGMAQIGIPFGEVAAAKNWLKISSPVAKPKKEHPKRPIEGFECQRSEVSGRRLWGLFADKFGTADSFFAQHFVLNYCPLVFMEETGRNRTPDKLPSNESIPLNKLCDEHLRSVVTVFQPEWVIGIGAFAENRLKDALADFNLRIGRILHPSPASPAANRDWSGTATKQLEELGVW